MNSIPEHTKHHLINCIYCSYSCCYSSSQAISCQQYDSNIINRMKSLQMQLPAWSVDSFDDVQHCCLPQKQLSLAVRACFVWYHSTVIGCEGLLCLKSFYQWPVMSASQIQAAMLCSLPTGMNILQISCHQVAGFPQVRQNKIPWLFQTNLKYFQAFWAFYNSNWKWWLHETSLLT